ncbi:hypothetical protein N665_0980s0023 [Sinapis alba]|nr:hypothetical protein N665_0980s0023 [Sinapis alba]
MDAFVVIIMIVFAFVVFPSIVVCCVRPHRNQTSLTSQSRVLETDKTVSKDGRTCFLITQGLVVLTRNVSTTAAAVTIADFGGDGGCCCGCDHDGGDGNGGGGGDGCGCEGSGVCGD